MQYNSTIYSHQQYKTVDHEGNIHEEVFNRIVWFIFKTTGTFIRKVIIMFKRQAGNLAQS